MTQDLIQIGKCGDICCIILNVPIYFIPIPLWVTRWGFYSKKNLYKVLPFIHNPDNPDKFFLNSLNHIISSHNKHSVITNNAIFFA